MVMEIIPGMLEFMNSKIEVGHKKVKILMVSLQAINVVIRLI